MIRRIFPIFVMMAIALPLSHCSTKDKKGSDAPETSAESSEEDGALLRRPPRLPQPAALPKLPGNNLFVVLGGNGSCNARQMNDTLPGLIDVRLFNSFVDVMIKPGYIQPTDRVLFACYEWQSTRMNFYDMRTSQQMIPLEETELDGLVLSMAQGASKVIIMGHSYGGWRAIKLASSPLLLSNLYVPMELISFDPISKVLCQKIREAACREAPADFTPSELFQISTRMNWMNIYQEAGLLLGSGPIPDAHVNVKSKSRHLEIQYDAAVWAVVRDYIVSFIAEK